MKRVVTRVSRKLGTSVASLVANFGVVDRDESELWMYGIRSHA
jgi:hypothetical protein